MSEIKIICASGREITEYIPELAKLRIQVFREFPYLYDGDLDYEEKYLSTYTKSSDTVIVLALDESKVIGASTGLPMEQETGDVQGPFKSAGLNPSEYFYFGESVLNKKYRGRGLGVRFFEERERHAKSLGRFKITTFCAVERPENHPLKPTNYRNLHQFWRNRGYVHHPELRTTFTWKDIDHAEEDKKPLSFWLKAL